MAERDRQGGLKQTIFKLVAVAIGMFVFALWVMPPLYTLFCEVTGLNGKTGAAYQPTKAEVDKTRWVEVQFVSTNNKNMPWEFKPKDFSIKVHPGQAVSTYFSAYNPTNRIMVAQAVPSVAPSSATNYFHKTECFCFAQQVLGPQEPAELGLQFIVDQALPKNIKTITLSYTLFDVTDDLPELVKSKQHTLVRNDISIGDDLAKNLSRE